MTTDEAVRLLAEALPDVITQEEYDDIYGDGGQPLETKHEWWTSPLELAQEMLTNPALAAALGVPVWEDAP